MNNDGSLAVFISGFFDWRFRLPQLAGWPELFDPHVGPKFPGLLPGRSARKGCPMKPESGGGAKSKGDFYHEPVMAEEVMRHLLPTRGKRILDGTVGGGGHALAILESGADLIGLDQDPQAVEHARERLKGFFQRASLIHANFAAFPEILETVGIGKVDGILMDLGVSSRQLDQSDRGFSFSGNGPLDMRMNPQGELTAEYLVNHSQEEELRFIFREYGEEPAASRIARAIVREREKAPIRSTGQLAALVESTCPRRGARLHPATRVFQALRIAVNDELRCLEAALQGSVSWLRPGGRLVVISYHSLEDRIVKRFLRHHSKVVLDRPEWPEPKPNPDYHFDCVQKKALRPSSSEVERNPRARSARMRVAERVNYA